MTGGGNFGFTDTGEFAESPETLRAYEPTAKYGLKKYKAELLDLARQNWHANHEAINDVVESLGMQEEVSPNLYRDYHAIANNCQHYVQWLNREYDSLINGGYK